MLKGIGGRRGAQGMHAEAVHGAIDAYLLTIELGC